MPYSLVGTAAAVSQGAASAAVTAAWGTNQNRTAGNLLVCQVSGTAVATLPAVPSGWTAAVQRAGTSCSASIFWKKATGSDAAPTIAAVTSAIWSVQLGEWAGGAANLFLDDSGANSGVTSPMTATCAAADVGAGDVVFGCWAEYRSMTATSTYTVALNNGATATNVANTGTSTQSHYGFTYGITTGNAAADSYSVSGFSTSQLTGTAAVVASFPLTPVDVGAVAMSGTGGMNTIGVLPAADLTDAFNVTGTPDVTKWTPSDSNLTVVAQGLQITCPPGTTTYHQLYSAAGGNYNYDYWDFSQSSASIQVINPGNQSIASLETYPLYISNETLVGASNANRIFWYINTGTIYAMSRLYNGTSIAGYTAPFDPINHAWLRIRGSATDGLIYWETSANGNTWVQRNNLSFTNDLRSTGIWIQAGTYNSEATGTTCVFDNLSITPPITTFAPGPNVITGDDAEFEGGLGGWTAQSNTATIAQTTAAAHSGLGSMAVTAISSQPYISSAKFLVTGGQYYLMTVWALAATIGRLFGLNINFFDSGNNYISGQGGTSPGVNDNTAAWTQGGLYINPGMMAPANARFVQINIQLFGCNAGEVHYFDTMVVQTSAGANSSLSVSSAIGATLSASSGMTIGASVKQLAAVTLAGGAALNVSGIQTQFASVSMAAYSNLITYFKTATLSDNFNTGVINSTYWWYEGTVNPTIVNGQVVQSLPGNSYADFYTAGTYDLTGSYCYVQLVNAGNQAQPTLQVLALDTSYAGWCVQNNTLQAYWVNIGGGALWSTAYNPAVHQWLRIRESGGNTYWDYGADGINWTNALTLPDSGNPTQTYPGWYSSYNGPGTQAVTWDNYNTGPVVNQGTVALAATAGMAVTGRLGTSEDSPALIVSNFGPFAGIGPNDIINAVTFRITQFQSDSGMGAPTYQLWDGTTAQIGATVTGSISTSSSNVDIVTWTGVTYAQLSTMQVRIYAHGSQGSTEYVDSVGATVNATITLGALLSGTAGMTVGASVKQIAAVTLAGGAALNIAPLVTEVAAVSMSDTTTLTVAGTRTQYASVALGGTAGLTVAAGVTQAASVAESGTASLTVAATVKEIASVGMGATAGLAIASQGQALGSIAMSGSTGMTVTGGQVTQVAQVALGATAGMGPVGMQTWPGQASLSALASLVVPISTSAGIRTGELLTITPAFGDCRGGYNVTITSTGTHPLNTTGQGVSFMWTPSSTTYVSPNAGATATSCVVKVPAGDLPTNQGGTGVVGTDGYVADVAYWQTGPGVSYGSITFTYTVYVSMGATAGMTAAASSQQNASIGMSGSSGLTVSGTQQITATGPAMAANSGMTVGATVKEVASVGLSGTAGMVISTQGIAVGAVGMSGSAGMVVAGSSVTEWASVALNGATNMAVRNPVLSASQKMAVLTDNFNVAGTPDTTKWQTSANAGCSVTDTGTVLSLNLGAGVAVGQGALAWAGNTTQPNGAYYDLTESYALFQLTSAGIQTDSTHQVLFQFLLYDQDNNSFGWSIQNNKIWWTDENGQSWNSTTYSAATYQWLRIREHAGYTYFDYSADGNVWTNFAQVPDNNWIHNPPNYLQPAFQFDSQVPSGLPAQSATIDNYNLPPAVSIPLSGTSGLTVGGAVTQSASVAESASAGLTVAAKVQEVASIGMSGSGVLAVATLGNVTAAVNLSGTAGMNVTASVQQLAGVTLAGGASLTVAGVISRIGAAALSATAGMTISAAPMTIGGSVSMSGTASLLPLSSVVGNVSMSATAGMTVTAGAVTEVATVALSGNASMTVVGTWVQMASVTLSGTAKLTVIPVGPKMATLTDNFNVNGTPDTTKWSIFGSNTSNVGGYLTTNLPANSSLGSMGPFSRIDYDLTESYFIVQLVNAGALLNTLQIQMEVVDTIGGFQNYWGISGTIIRAYLQGTGWVGPGVSGTPYNPSVHQWVRIREHAGTVYFDYSADGNIWTNFGSGPTMQGATYMNARLLATDTNEASASTVQFDNFNLPPASSVPMSGTAGMTVGPGLITEVGSVSMSASAGMTTAGVVTEVAAVNMVAQAGMAVITQTTVNLSATAGMTVAGTRVVPGTVPLQGTAGMTVVASITQLASVTLAGGASLNVGGVLVTEVASIGMSATTGMTASTAIIGVANLVGTSTLTVAAKVTELASVALSGNASLAVAGVVKEIGAVALSGSTTLTIAAQGDQVASVHLAGNASLVVAGTVKELAAVTMSAQSGMTVIGIVLEMAMVTMSATANLTVAGTVATGGAAVNMTAVSNLFLTTFVIRYSTIVMSASTGMTVVGDSHPVKYVFRDLLKGNGKAVLYPYPAVGATPETSG